MKIILVSAFSPRFNHVPSKRTEKLAKYLSKHVETILIAGMPKIPNGSPYFKATPDIGNSKLIEIIGKPLSKKFKSSSVNNRKRLFDPEFITGIKRNIGPIVEQLIPISSGGAILYKRNAFVRAIMKEITNSSDNHVVLFTTYNPWFITKIGYKISRKNNILWIADFRDPPFNSPHQETTFLSPFKKLTSRILREADLVSAVNKSILNDFSKVFYDNSKYILLTNGFDKDDIEAVNDNTKFSLRDGGKNKDEFWIAYTGRFYPRAGGDLEPFADVLKILKNKYLEIFSKIKFVYAGSNSYYVRKVFRERDIEKSLIDLGQISRSDAVRLQNNSDLLLLVTYTGNKSEMGKGIITAKVFEYFSSKTPILMIGSKEWELKKALLSDGISKIFQSNEIDKMVQYLIKIVKKEYAGNIELRRNYIKHYDYSFLASKLLEKIFYKLKEH